MKKISIYSTHYNSKEDWEEFLSELEFTAEEIMEINEVELRIQSVAVPCTTPNC